MADENDVRIVALKCPSCGGALRVQAGEDRTRCDHCGSTVLVVDARTGETRVETAEPESPEEAAATKRLTKIVLWIIVLAFALPMIGTLLVNVVVAVISLILAFTVSGGAP
jgi:DNA-directed RNA polymerase subunit RPC12/RpoP